MHNTYIVYIHVNSLYIVHVHTQEQSILDLSWLYYKYNITRMNHMI